MVAPMVVVESMDGDSVEVSGDVEFISCSVTPDELAGGYLMVTGEISTDGDEPLPAGADSTGEDGVATVVGVTVPDHTLVSVSKTESVGMLRLADGGNLVIEDNAGANLIVNDAAEGTASAVDGELDSSGRLADATGPAAPGALGPDPAPPTQWRTLTAGEDAGEDTVSLITNSLDELQSALLEEQRILDNEQKKQAVTQAAARTGTIPSCDTVTDIYISDGATMTVADDFTMCSDRTADVHPVVQLLVISLIILATALLVRTIRKRRAEQKAETSSAELLRDTDGTAGVISAHTTSARSLRAAAASRTANLIRNQENKSASAGAAAAAAATAAGSGHRARERSNSGGRSPSSERLEETASPRTMAMHDVFYGNDEDGGFLGTWKTHKGIPPKKEAPSRKAIKIMRIPHDDTKSTRQQKGPAILPLHPHRPVVNNAGAPTKKQVKDHASNTARPKGPQPQPPAARSDPEQEAAQIPKSPVLKPSTPVSDARTWSDLVKHTSSSDAPYISDGSEDGNFSLQHERPGPVTASFQTINIEIPRPDQMEIEQLHFPDGTIQPHNPGLLILTEGAEIKSGVLRGPDLTLHFSQLEATHDKYIESW